jgi:hypothetical protein
MDRRLYTYVQDESGQCDVLALASDGVKTAVEDGTLRAGAVVRLREITRFYIRPLALKNFIECVPGAHTSGIATCWSAEGAC